MSMQQAIPYNNLSFRVFGSLAAAACVVHFGVSTSFFRLILMPAYYLAMAVSFAIAFILVSHIHFITVFLDKRVSWETPVRRGLFQFLLGLLLPAIGAFFMAALYFAANGKNIHEVGYLRFDFPIIVALLFLLNIYYYQKYYIWKLRNLRAQPPAPAPAAEIPYPEAVPRNEPPPQPPAPVQTILVSLHNRDIALPVTEICYFFRHQGCYWIRTMEGRTYPLDMTLVEIENRFSGQDFFRINRQLLINRSIILDYTPGKGRGTLCLEVPADKADIQHIQATDLFTVSRERVPGFKSWLGRQQGVLAPQSP